MAFLVGGANSASGAYEIDNSLRVNGDLHHLSLIFDSAETSANQKKFTFSCWIKLGNSPQMATTVKKAILESTDAASSTDSIGYGHPAAAKFFYYQGAGNKKFSTTAVYRDPSAWYNLVIAVDTTDGTANDRVKMWVNGISQTLIQSNGALVEDSETNFGNAGDDITATSPDSGNFIHNVNTYYNSYENDRNIDGYFADLNFHSGVVGTHLNFGEFNDNGVWIPKAPTLAYNAYSYRLEFKQTGTSANASGIGADTSGSTNHFAIGQGSGTAALDVTTDTPTNNFATMNSIASIATLSEGNCKAVTTGGERMAGASTIGMANGKWYMEYKITDINSINVIVGVDNDAGLSFSDFRDNDDFWNAANTYAYQSSGTKRSTGVDASYGNSYTTGDIIGIALDMDNRKLYFSKNGTFQNSGDPTTGATGTGSAFDLTAGYTYFFQAADQDSSSGFTVEANFGNPSFSISSGNADANGYGNFEYAPPSGYYALCTKNLAEFG